MSKLDELIDKLCPNGVEYKKLKEVCKIITAPKKLNSKEYLDFGNYPIIDQGKNYIIGYTNNTQALLCADEYVLFGDHTREVKYVNFKFAQGADGLKILQPKISMKTRFLYHALSSLNIPNRGYNRHWTIVQELSIPVAPIEVQEEIVRILDSFTNLRTKLTSDLALELTARKKQYEYYRDKLLTFGDDIECKRLGDIGEVSMCKRILKSETNTVGDVPFYKIGTFGKTPDAYITQEKFQEYKSKYSFPKKGEILISAAGTIGRTVIYDGKPAYYQDSNIVWLAHDESIVLNKYLYYFYKLNPWTIANGGTIARLYNDNIRKTLIPVPPIEEQKRIVDILDRFDKLCNDISDGLPAEIEARKKQYEYYRDKLLAFKPCDCKKC